MISLDDAPGSTYPRSVDLLALDEALEKLAAVDARKARALELKFFGGLEMAEIASVLNISPKTVEKDIRLGAAWLRSVLSAPAAMTQNVFAAWRLCTMRRPGWIAGERTRFIRGALRRGRGFAS